MSRRSLPLVFSCEHARNAVPTRLEPAFRGHEAVLASHRGWDPGALEVAQRLARYFTAPLVAGRYSRLVIDLNRSPHHPHLFSSWTRDLDRATRDWLREVHARHWAEVSRRLVALARTGRVVHVALHSFTPELDGVVRNAEIGLLYDPGRASELDLARRLAQQLTRNDCRVRRNYPYRGVADGLPTALRRRFGPSYVGLEFELNQAFVLELGLGEVAHRVRTALAAALA